MWAQVTGTMAGPSGEFSYCALTSTRLYARQEVTFQGETTRVDRFPGVRQYVLEFENLVATLRTGVDFPWTLEDARGTQAMIDLVRANEV